MTIDGWQLWQPGSVLKDLPLVDKLLPRLATWEANTHPAQVKMREYLTELKIPLQPVMQDHTELYLQLEIDVGSPERLSQHYDLENYLTPIVQHLGSRHFVFVSATKGVGGGSRLRVGQAEPRDDLPATGRLAHFAHRAGSGPQIKERLRLALAEEIAAGKLGRLPPGLAEVHLAWRCHPARRNWANLWKLTGDAPGPILGLTHASNPYAPQDDRITALYLHRTDASELGHDVEIGLWWRRRPEQDYG